MKKTVLVSLSVFAFVFILIMAWRHGRSPSLVGHWQGTWGVPGDTYPIDMVFTQDGTETSRNGTPNGPMVTMSRYHVSNDTLYSNVASATVNGRPMNSVGIYIGNGPNAPPTAIPFHLQGDRLDFGNTGDNTFMTLTRVR